MSASEHERKPGDSSPQVNIAIVGAGISGLAAASDLLRLSAQSPVHLNVTIVEARDRVGGRTYTQPFADGSGESVDLGASFVHGTHDNPLTEMSKSVPMSLYLPPETSSSRYLSRTAGGAALNTSEADRLDFVSFSAIFSRLRALAQEHPEISFDQSRSMQDALLSDQPEIRRALWPSDKESPNTDVVQAAQSFMPVWAGWTGAPLDQVALKWWGFEREYQGEDAVVKEGYGPTLVEHYRKDAVARGATLRLSTEVISIEDDGDGGPLKLSIIDHARNKERAVLEADQVICTLPIGVLQSVAEQTFFSPPLPRRRIDALLRIGSGLLDKVVLRYTEAWWRVPDLPTDQRNPIILLCPPSVRISAQGALEIDPAAGSESGTAAHPSALESLRDDPLFVYDYDIVKGQPTLVAFIAPPLAEDLEGQDDQDIGRVLHQRLLESVCPASGPPPPPPLEVIVTRWRQDPYARGSYSYLPAADPSPSGRAGATPLDLDELSHPLWGGRLGFAGEHCHADCYASVHGALLSGQREAARVWSELRRARGM